MLIHTLFVLALASSPQPSPAVASDTTDPIARRTTFGVAIGPVSDAFRAIGYLEPNEGVMLVKVQPGSAAAAARLKDGDMVLAINGKRVDETTLFATIRDIKRGEPFRVEFLRDGKWNETKVVIDP
jgi:S1-C subfamily serine protease